MTRRYLTPTAAAAANQPGRDPLARLTLT